MKKVIAAVIVSMISAGAIIASIVTLLRGMDD